MDQMWCEFVYFTIVFIHTFVTKSYITLENFSNSRLLISAALVCLSSAVNLIIFCVFFSLALKLHETADIRSQNS